VSAIMAPSLPVMTSRSAASRSACSGLKQIMNRRAHIDGQPGGSAVAGLTPNRPPTRDGWRCGPVASRSLCVRRRRAKFLWHGSYSKRGAEALVEEGGTKRRAGVERAVTAMGGTLEAMYFAFGDDDYYAIVDLPDNVSGAAVSLATALADAVRLKTVVLLTAEELDEAARRAHEYQGPGAR
jgi:uncharacterized protein with GYD domain